VTAASGHEVAALGGVGVIPAERRIVATLTDRKLTGDWELARRTRVVAVLSALTLDLREARIPAGVTTLEISATLAEVKVILPPGLRVECDGTAVLGAFTQKESGYPMASDADAPVLRISGTAALAEVSVRTRLPDETALAALARDWSR
jgi:hypothetical protein